MTAATRRNASAHGKAIVVATLFATVAIAPSALPATESAPAGTLDLRVIADGILEPLVPGGNAERGRALIIARDAANCILCHAVSDPGVRVAGNVGPSLDGVGRRLSVAQLRLRVADNMRVHPETIMPSYYRVVGFELVAGAYRGKPILDAGQVEDIVAYLSSLQ